MLENIKIMLGDAASNFPDELINLYLTYAEAEVKSLTGRATLDAELLIVVQKITKLMLNKHNMEGLSGTSFNGVSETYIDGYPEDIQSVINRKRKIKVM